MITGLAPDNPGAEVAPNGEPTNDPNDEPNGERQRRTKHRANDGRESVVDSAELL